VRRHNSANDSQPSIFWGFECRLIYWGRYVNEPTSLFFFPRHQPLQASGRRAGMSAGHLNATRNPRQQVHRKWDRVRKATEQESGD